jgi:regulator of RNase E activity RraA
MAEPLPKFDLPAPAIVQSLPIAGPPFARPDPALIGALHGVGTATASALMHRMGVRQTFIHGPLSRQPGAKIVGPVVTLQFMPKREDVMAGLARQVTEERLETATALWAVFEAVQQGDILAVQAYGDAYTGTMGEMLVTYFKGRGGVGIVVDGCVRDWPHLQEIGTPIWAVGVTPNYASQGDFLPWAYNVPVALSRVLVIPGDIMIADDDGVVVVPAGMAEQVLKHTLDHENWEEFSRLRLAEGGALRKYYPLNADGQAEYEAWRKNRT